MSLKNDEKITNAFNNAQLAIDSLGQFLAMPIVTDRDQAGIIQAFEYSFETSWKLIKKIAEFSGEDVNTPREAFMFAYRTKLIDDENTCLSMLKHRNLTSHTYKRKLAKEVLNAIKNDYLPLFKKLLDEIVSRVSW